MRVVPILLLCGGNEHWKCAYRDVQAEAFQWHDHIYRLENLRLALHVISAAAHVHRLS